MFTDDMIEQRARCGPMWLGSEKVCNLEKVVRAASAGAKRMSATVRRRALSGSERGVWMWRRAGGWLDAARGDAGAQLPARSGYMISEAYGGSSGMPSKGYPVGEPWFVS